MGHGAFDRCPDDGEADVERCVVGVKLGLSEAVFDRDQVDAVDADVVGAENVIQAGQAACS